MESVYHVPCIYNCITAPVPPLKVSVPGSKSITNRALLLAALAGGTSTLRGALFSDDCRYFLECLKSLGFDIKCDETGATVQIAGYGGNIPNSEADLYVGSAGTAARFLSAWLGTGYGTYHMDASGQMRKRPMAPLLRSLEELGCEITYQEKEGYFPFTLKSHGFGKDHISIDIDSSSQFLSALLIASVLSPRDMEITLKGTHGMSYINMTIQMMSQFGVNVLRPSNDLFVIPCGQHLHWVDYQIEPDVSAACYFYAFAPLLNIPVKVDNIHGDSLQGDIAFLSILEQMGCKSFTEDDGILLTPPKDHILHGVDVDMSSCSDQAITLAAIAPYADSPTTIRNIGHIRHQECDRMEAIANELTRTGIRVAATENDLTVFPGVPHAASIETYSDHRMAMGFSLMGLRTPGISIQDPECCSKTFPDYFSVLEKATEELT